MKAVIIDDHELIREGFVHVLMACDLFDEILDISEVESLYELASAHPDIGLVLLDIQLLEMTTVETINSIKEKMPNVMIAILSGLENAERAHAFFENGVVGYIPKSSPNSILIEAVTQLVSGENYYPPFLDASNVQQVSQRLTQRQSDVLGFMGLGLTNKEIARKLDLSESTVKTHSSAILRVFDVDSRFKAVKKATECGILK